MLSCHKMFIQQLNPGTPETPETSEIYTKQTSILRLHVYCTSTLRLRIRWVWSPKAIGGCSGKAATPDPAMRGEKGSNVCTGYTYCTSPYLPSAARRRPCRTILLHLAPGERNYKSTTSFQQNWMISLWKLRQPNLEQFPQVSSGFSYF